MLPGVPGMKAGRPVIQAAPLRADTASRVTGTGVSDRGASCTFIETRHIMGMKTYGASGAQYRMDERGYAISGATGEAAQAYELALAAFQSWRTGADQQVALALQEAPGFVMAHVLQAYTYLCSREPARVKCARGASAAAARLPANDRERMHLAIISAAVADDYELAKTRLDELLRQYPRDILALQVGHAFDYLSGDIERLGVRVASVMPAWSPGIPGYHAVLAMRAFSMEECGDYEMAEEYARSAIELDRFDARAHHVMAHIFEMTLRPGDGIRWLRDNLDYWNVDTIVATHCWWHHALYQLARGDVDGALGLYDERVRASRSGAIADLIDASALLWRIQLKGGATGDRWPEVAAAWDAHIDDAFCSFNDLHAMLAFVGAGEQDSVRRLELALVGELPKRTRHGATTRHFGLAGCEAVAAFGRGDNSRALVLLAGLPPVAQRFGGSHAQRDVLHLTMLEAAARTRRDTTRPARGRLVAPERFTAYPPSAAQRSGRAIPAGA
jgi:tetratricopeptide (TPR) repeat protein